MNMNQKSLEEAHAMIARYQQKNGAIAITEKQATNCGAFSCSGLCYYTCNYTCHVACKSGCFNV